MAAAKEKQHELTLEQLAHEVAELKKQVVELKEREARHWKKTENFLSKFGIYHSSNAEQRAIFIIDRLTRGGANGIALTAAQGMIEQFALPVALDAESGKKLNSPFWIPEIIPEVIEEQVEQFESEPDAGSDNKAVV